MIDVGSSRRERGNLKSFDSSGGTGLCPCVASCAYCALLDKCTASSIQAAMPCACFILFPRLVDMLCVPRVLRYEYHAISRYH